MSTEQNYVGGGSHANDSEQSANQIPADFTAATPAVCAGDSFQLHFFAGDSADLLYHLLSAERDRLTQLTPWKLIENDFELFQEIMEDIDRINLQMHHLFCGLNDRLKALVKQSEGEKAGITKEVEASQERMALMEKVMKLRKEQLEVLEKQATSIVAS